MLKKKSILLIDDHALFREGLKAIIERDVRFQVVGETGDGREGVKMATNLKPDIVLMDISLADESGIQLTQKILTLLPGTRVMIVSMHSNIECIAEAFQAGATGYVVKESASEKLLQGLEYVSRGEYFFDTPVSRKMLKRVMGSNIKEAKSPESAYATLTPREQEIMRMLAEGLSNREVADKLFISPRTVENHRASIMSKLGLHRAHELVRYAARLGLINVDSWKE